MMFAVRGAGQAIPAVKVTSLLLMDISDTGRDRRFIWTGSRPVMGYLSSGAAAGFLIAGATDPAMQAIQAMAE